MRLAICFVFTIALLIGCNRGSGGNPKFVGMWTEINTSGQVVEFDFKTDGVFILKLAFRGDTDEGKGTWKSISDNTIELTFEGGNQKTAVMMDSNTIEMTDKNQYKSKYIRKKQLISR